MSPRAKLLVRFVAVVAAASLALALFTKRTETLPERPMVAADSQKRVGAIIEPPASHSANESPLLGVASAGPVRAFGRETDLLKFSQEALLSNNPAVAYEAYVASRECVGVTEMADELTAISSGSRAARLQGNLSPERQLAIHSILGACNGFVRNGPSFGRRIVQSLLEHGKTLRGQEFDAQQLARSDRDAAIRALLFSDSPAARESAVSLILPVWSKYQGIADSSDDRASLLAIAAALAMCDLGKACSKDSFPVHALCALSGECRSELWADWESAYTDTDAKLILAYKSQLVRATLAKNLSLLAAPIK